MSTYDLEEQEQLAALKAWWKDNGNTVLLAVIAALVVVAGWYGWSLYQRSQAAQASALYETLQKAARANDVKATRDAAESILENYPRTTYAPLAALTAAKVHFQSGDLKTARAQLQWVIDNARNEQVRAIARLRLANVLLDEGTPDEALKVIDVKPEPAFDALYAAQRGDILVAQKKLGEARSAYRSALEKSNEKDLALRESLRLRLDALGEGP
jgi:predicted negative regulator of RcsB-dependent stress response